MASQDKTRTAQPSKILLDELYSSENQQFLHRFVEFDSYEFLKHFSIKWIEDKRPWARAQFIDYLHGSLNHPGHEVVFKRTLKWALDKDDAELLAHFTVVLDGLVRRQRISSVTFNFRRQEPYRRDYLFAKSNRTVRNETGRFKEYRYLKKTYRTSLPDTINWPHHRLFSQRTRAHLRRRVWRHFRFMAHKNPAKYVESLVATLAIYEDSQFSSGEAILDNWALMHACYFDSPEITFTASHTNVAQGKSLSSLAPAP